MSSITQVHAPDAPAPLPVFSQALIANGFVFCSGSIGFDKDMHLVKGGIKPQTEQTLRNLAAVLKAAGTDLSKVVKVNVYIKTFDHFKDMNESYVAFFPGVKPARTCVVVAALPFGMDVEMECTALVE